MLTDEMKKSIEEIVDEALSNLETKEEEKQEEVKKSEEGEKEEETKSEPEAKEEDSSEKEEDVEKAKKGEAPKEKTCENGGEDKIKSGSPYQENQKMMKSLEELSEILPQDEVDLIAAWREENKTEENVAKSKSGLQDSTDIGEIVKSAVASATEGLKKSFDDAISEKDELIKSMNERIEKMASQPAYDKRSVDSLEPIEKSENKPSDNISKSQVLDTMLDLQKSGAGITAYHVTRFEATGEIVDPKVEKLVKETLNKKLSN